MRFDEGNRAAQFKYGGERRREGDGEKTNGGWINREVEEKLLQKKYEKFKRTTENMEMSSKMRLIHNFEKLLILRVSLENTY